MIETIILFVLVFLLGYFIFFTLPKYFNPWTECNDYETLKSYKLSKGGLICGHCEKVFRHELFEKHIEECMRKTQ